MLTEKIKALAAQITDELIDFRRDLHMHPELSNEEHYTAARIAEELDKIEGMEVFRGLAGGTGVGVVRRARSPTPRKNSPIISTMSCQYATNTASSVPRCSSTS